MLRHIFVTIALCTLVAASALGAESALLDFQGFAHETGGFPPSATGDTLSIPCVVDNLSQNLGIDLQATEVTGWITGLVSTGSEDLGDGVTATHFEAGTIAFYSDPSRDHTFGVNPPNASVPSSFTNGELCLGGTLEDFVLFFNSTTNGGAFEARVVFTTGTCLPRLQAIRAEGFTFGGILARAVAGQAPQGYDLQVDGFLQAGGVTSAACEFDCMALTEADLHFPHDHEHGHGKHSSNSKFEIEGRFSPCVDSGPLDPGAQEVVVRIGNFTQTFPAGSLKLEKHHDEDEQEWEYETKPRQGKVHELEIEREEDGSWEFEIEGRGVARDVLLPLAPTLHVELVIGGAEGTAEAVLKQHKNKKKYSFDGDDDACRPASTRVAGGTPSSLAAPARTPLLTAHPNPFNARTTLALEMPTAASANLQLFDIRGRLVRVVVAGHLDAGEHLFVWDGTDSGGRAAASGVYIVRLVTPGGATSRRIVMAK